ncbi:MAG: sensor histidine kinase [Campylobacterota bacterium]
MKLLKTEKNILNTIKYGPVLFVILLSFLITQSLITQREHSLEKELKQFKQNYINTQKLKVKNEVDKLYNLIKSRKITSEQILKKELKQRVYEAHSMATAIYDKSMPEHSNKISFEIIKKSLGSLKFNNDRGYFFIVDKKGSLLLQPFNKEFEGGSLIDFEDANGYKFVEKIVQTIKNKSESYDSYYWYKPNDTTQAYKKISFYKYFEPYDIVIGTGEYTKAFERELKQKIIKQLNNEEYLGSNKIFIYTSEGLCLVHPNKDYIGVNRYFVKNSQDKYIVQDVINFAKKSKEGFISYISSVKNEDTIKEKNKMSYVKYFKEWDLLIGSGVNLEELNKKIESRSNSIKEENKKILEKIILISFILTIIFAIIFFYISKLIEKKFLKYQEDLEEEINKTIEKEKLLVQQSKMATMGEMIGSISHQWKQPLSLISTSNGMLKLNMEVKSFPKEDLEQSIKNIDYSVQNLAQTIDDFRNFFNPNKKKESFEISSAIEKTLKLIKSQFKNNDIKLIQDFQNIEVYAVENELLQTLINILKNSKDEFEIKKEQEIKIVKVTAKQENSLAIITIHDNAGGIPEDILPKIFDAYFTTKEKQGGSGIGLYMSKQIVESMNGKISVENVKLEYEGKKYMGAQFKIELPVK